MTRLFLIPSTLSPGSVALFYVHLGDCRSPPGRPSASTQRQRYHYPPRNQMTLGPTNNHPTFPAKQGSSSKHWVNF